MYQFGESFHPKKERLLYRRLTASIIDDRQVHWIHECICNLEVNLKNLLMYEEFCPVCDAVQSGKEWRQEVFLTHRFACTRLQARYPK
jgi:hypothetical protein